MHRHCSRITEAEVGSGWGGLRFSAQGYPGRIPEIEVGAKWASLGWPMQRPPGWMVGAEAGHKCVGGCIPGHSVQQLPWQGGWS